MTWQGAFRVIIRVIFIFAYIAFLAASIRHVATFFHNFESDPADWVNPYTLAVSIDLTSLVLTVGVMFFRKNMPWYAQSFTWLFIVALTAFSWFVNWEYAMTYQGNDLRVNDTLRMLNPILASSFAFLNLAYSVVAEFFSSKTETAAELAAKVDELEQLEEQQRRLLAYKERTKQPGVIQRVKNTALEARAAVNEVLTTEPEQATAKQPEERAEREDATTLAAQFMQSDLAEQTPASQAPIAETEQVQEIAIPPVVPAENAMPSAPQAAYAEAQPASNTMAQAASTAFFAHQHAAQEAVILTRDDSVAEMEGEQKFITEPLSMEASQYIIDGQLDSMALETDGEELFEKKDSSENDVLLPAWAGGEDVDTFLTMEDMLPYIPTGDTSSMSKISSNTGKLTRRKPMTVPEAAEALAVSERRIRELRSQGVLVTDESNKIKVSSVNAYMNKRKTKQPVMESH
ncbi:hypothetical protein [Dictyobacter arantiisoli]|uniref:Uncharacterized protein n=1 Tax=Dictyobacter arantiisoli TaxID=2014874 RepID=A0A5A5TH82_9CHLR|nr:hypothetical protein [Dictyobacter arantiisoli]GCF10930.1 hypothetical protein KDI_44940 [Dictyobacter arantiisoli]